MNQITVVVIENEPNTLGQIVDFLNWKDFDVYGTTNEEDGLALVLEYQPDIVLCNIILPSMDGYDLLTDVRGYSDKIPEITFVFLIAEVGIFDGKCVGVVSNSEADGYVTKPYFFPDLIEAVESRL